MPLNIDKLAHIIQKSHMVYPPSEIQGLMVSKRFNGSASSTALNFSS